MLVTSGSLLAASGPGDGSARAAANLPHRLMLAEVAADSGSGTRLLPSPTTTIAAPTIPPAEVAPPGYLRPPMYTPPGNYGY
jgi:hypothetical protein